MKATSECLVASPRTKKRLSKVEKQEVQKVENWHFSHGFGQKITIFHLFLCNIGLENVFKDILELKKRLTK